MSLSHVTTLLLPLLVEKIKCFQWYVWTITNNLNDCRRTNKMFGRRHALTNTNSSIIGLGYCIKH